MKDGSLDFNQRLYVPNISLRNELLHDFHQIASAGHLEERKIRHRISQLYYCKTLRNDVSEYVKSCSICQKTKSRNTKLFGLRQPIAHLDAKWSVITMDFSGPLPETKNGLRRILNVADNLSKMLRAIPIPENYDTIFVAKQFCEHGNRIHSLPHKIISDRDSIFMSKLWKIHLVNLTSKSPPQQLITLRRTEN